MYDSLPPPPNFIIIPITTVYLDILTTFFQRHGCTVENVSVPYLYRVIFFIGTLRRHMPQALDLRYQLILPDGMRMEQVQPPNLPYSFLSIPPEP